VVVPVESLLGGVLAPQEAQTTAVKRMVAVKMSLFMGGASHTVSWVGRTSDAHLP
jgi:hypothetical protein